MRISVLFPHRIKNSAIQELLERYVRYASRSTQIDIVYSPLTTPAGKLTRTASERVAGSRSYVLSEHGRAVTTEWFSGIVESVRMSGQPLLFVVGDAQGYPRELESMCEGKIALSPLTLPHEMALLILVEQLWGAVSIIEGHPYNK